jgi:hypothetical protein
VGSVKSVFASIEIAVDAADDWEDGQLRGDTNPRHALLHDHGERWARNNSTSTVYHVETEKAEQSARDWWSNAKLVEIPLVFRVLLVILKTKRALCCWLVAVKLASR